MRGWWWQKKSHIHCPTHFLAPSLSLSLSLSLTWRMFSRSWEIMRSFFTNSMCSASALEKKWKEKVKCGATV